MLSRSHPTMLRLFETYPRPGLLTVGCLGGLCAKKQSGQLSEGPTAWRLLSSEEMVFIILRVMTLLLQNKV
jgi:hypothetical protein